MLSGKKVLLGVTASIAAYKAAVLTRLLVKSGAEVRIIMTPAAADFITPLTLATLSRNPVQLEYFTPEDGVWSNHVELAEWADVFVMAPLTANTLGKMAGGLCDNLLLATFLSYGKSVWMAPAMDLEMYRNPNVKGNLEALMAQGHRLIPAEHGELASGLVGEGRMAEPEHIMEVLDAHYGSAGPLYGKKVMITAGPTYEPIDPVRFIGNRSSGKMGYAIAEKAQSMGAEVTLISGPVNLDSPEGVDVVHVETAGEMFDQAVRVAKDVDLMIMAAAVADYTVDDVAPEKIKKKGEKMDLELSKTKDILGHLGQSKTKAQTIVGFALETENELENARKKLKAKNADIIVLNSLQDQGAGFHHDTNKVTLVDQRGQTHDIGLKSKLEVAQEILDYVVLYTEQLP